jgi:hypothetical protein
MEQWATGDAIGSLHARRDFDMPSGILVALRRCGPDEAYRELLAAAKRHGVGVIAMASVVDLACGHTKSLTQNSGSARSAAAGEWVVSWTKVIARPQAPGQCSSEGLVGAPAYPLNG